MFITDVTRSFEIPGEPGVTVTIRKLLRKQQRKAREARTVAYVQTVKTFGGASALRDMQGLGAKDETAPVVPAPETKPVDPLQEFDEDAVLELGVTNFSPQPIDTTREQLIDRLDAEDATFIAREIIAFTRGERENAEERKNA